MTQDASATSRPLTIEVDRRDGAVVVRVAGEATMDRTVQLRDALYAVAEERFPQIFLDLTGLEFICSEGLGVLVATHLRSYRHAGVLKLVAPGLRVAEVLRRTRLDRVFPSYDSVEQALVR